LCIIITNSDAYDKYPTDLPSLQDILWRIRLYASIDSPIT
jgi:hypothetical protein